MTDEERQRLEAAVADWQAGRPIDPATVEWVAEQHRADPEARDRIGDAAVESFTARRSTPPKKG